MKYLIKIHCMECDMAFLSKIHLTRHSVVHGGKPHKYQQCDGAFVKEKD